MQYNDITWVSISGKKLDMSPIAVKMQLPSNFSPSCCLFKNSTPTGESCRMLTPDIVPVL